VSDDGVRIAAERGPERRGGGSGSPVSDDGEHAAYLLGLADDALVYAQRLGEWVSRAPEMEEDMALANIGLDLLGQARALLSRAGELDGTGRSEDDLAYLRDERDFRNVHLVEQERAGFAFEMTRLLWFSSYQRELYAALTGADDEVVAGVAGKAVKEVAYHRDHAAQWVLRLGDGTSESHDRMQVALEQVAPYVDELFEDDAAAVAAAEAGLGVRPSTLAPAARGWVASVVAEATLEPPATPGWRSRGGRVGVHSTPMGHLLAEMQHLTRSHPGARW
jgi:ring-1,2-phenylacetyl-CoA epoxidase subunit PaaC